MDQFLRSLEEFFTIMHKITIRVQNSDIRKGVPCSAGNCAVALAARREIPSEYSVVVLDRKLRLIQKNGDGFKEVPLPSEVISFIGAFDKKENVSPLTFSLEIEYPTDKDTGSAFRTPVSESFKWYESSEPSRTELLALSKKKYS